MMSVHPCRLDAAGFGNGGVAPFGNGAGNVFFGVGAAVADSAAAATAALFETGAAIAPSGEDAVAASSPSVSLAAPGTDLVGIGGAVGGTSSDS